MENKIVLIVDDKADVNSFAQPYFFDLPQVEIHQRDNIESGIEFFKANQMNIIMVLVDLKLKNSDTGVEFIRLLLNNFEINNLKIILYSKHLGDSEFKDDLEDEVFINIEKYKLMAGNYSPFIKHCVDKLQKIIHTL